MKKISCNIIRDILPLYVDGVVCDDTKNMVEEHLHFCDSCRKELETLNDDVVLPTSQNAQLSEVRILKKIKRTFLKKRVIAATISVIIAIAAVIGLCSLLMVFRIYVPYDSSLITIEENNGELYAQYSGGGLSGTVSHNPVKVVVDGHEKEIVIFYYYETLWSKYIAPAYDDSSNQAMHKTATFLLGKKEQIDQVYYGEFDPKLFSSKPPAILNEWKLVY